MDAPVGAGVDVELEIRRSRFLTRLRRVTNEDDARSMIDERRRAHFDARHHCSAFILGADSHSARSSDDGEPAGTAGTPMLTVLQRHSLSDVVAVVTRYFGGIKLGAGGLARAYSAAVTQAIDAVGSRDVTMSRVLRVDVPMSDAGAIEAQLRGLLLPGGVPVSIDGVQWAQCARITLSVPVGSEPDFTAAIAALSGGTVEAVPIGERWGDIRG
ncbi:MAG: YigZ family protein [Arachnia sp.]